MINSVCGVSAMNEDVITRREHEAFADLMKSENERLREEDTRQNKRLDIVEEAIKNFGKVQASMEKMETVMMSTLKEIEKQGQRLERLESKDGEMWRKVTGYIVTAIVGIVIGFVFKQIGM